MTINANNNIINLKNTLSCLHPCAGVSGGVKGEAMSIPPERPSGEEGTGGHLSSGGKHDDGGDDYKYIHNTVGKKFHRMCIKIWY